MKLLVRSIATLSLTQFTICCGGTYAGDIGAGFSYDRHIGFVTYEKEKTILAIENKDLKKGQKLLVLYKYKGEKLDILEATIMEQLPSGMTGLKATMAFKRQPSLYEIDRPRMEAVAFIPIIGISKYDPKKPSIDIDGDGKAEYLYSCTSMEGLHYIVRSGHPRTGVLRKDFYYYLGYDVNPSCQDSDYK